MEFVSQDHAARYEICMVSRIRIRKNEELELQIPGCYPSFILMSHISFLDSRSRLVFPIFRLHCLKYSSMEQY